MARGNTATVDPSVGWAVDNRGYIHGGFDTPVFEKSKQRHNSRLTSRRNKLKSARKSANKISRGADTKEKS